MRTEPWLRGPIEGVDPRTAPILYAFEQAREDLADHTEGLTPEQFWVRPFGFGATGFHVSHIAGSTRRLMTYLQGRQLTQAQIEQSKGEAEPGATREELLADLDAAFRDAEAVVRAIDPATIAEPRAVGRMKLPTTVIGLLTHIAEHTQRHVGQAIAAAKLARAYSNE
jgi:uncharacterized damage-inducible protein DinB